MMSQFQYLTMLTDSAMKSELSGMQIDENEQITACVILNTEEGSTKFGNCVLVDKSGTMNYLSENSGEGVVCAKPVECFECITSSRDEALRAKDHFKEGIINAVALFNPTAAEQHYSDLK